MEDGGSSAMDLLNPHLPSLSSYWLAALRDHAHLTLPPEFSSQLPPNGGTFFSLNVMDVVRPYYEANWSALLHASAIWLKMNSKGEQKSSLPQPLISGSGSGLFSPMAGGLDDFHLVLGLAVQSLCFSSTLDRPLTLNNCLQSLKILLSSERASQELVERSQLSTELLSVLHRVLLTSQNKAMHILALQVSLLIGGSLVTAVKTSSLPLEDDINPTTSPTYSLLKVSACCLFRLIPGLASLEPSTATPLSAGALSHDDVTLISLSLSLLVTVVSLCSPQSALALLPSLLHMFLSSLQHTSAVSGAGSAISAGLQTLRELCSSLKLEDGEVGAGLVGVLRSALCSVLETKEVPSAVTYCRMSEETRLLVMAVFMLASSSTGEVCPPHSDQFTACVGLITHCLNSSNAKVTHTHINTHQVTVESTFAILYIYRVTHLLYPDRFRLGLCRSASQCFRGVGPLQAVLVSSMPWGHV